MKTFRDLIDRWGIGQFAEAIGVDYGTAQVMRHRDSVSPDHFPSIVESAVARGWTDISTDILHDLRRARRKRGGLGFAPDPPKDIEAQPAA